MKYPVEYAHGKYELGVRWRLTRWPRKPVLTSFDGIYARDLATFHDEKCADAFIAFMDRVTREVPERRGRWVRMAGFPACSRCGCSPAAWEPKEKDGIFPPFCHGCGAKMGKVSEEEWCSLTREEQSHDEE